nr:MAG: hypothetical protein [Bacteriophage sp.]
MRCTGFALIFHSKSRCIIASGDDSINGVWMPGKYAAGKKLSHDTSTAARSCKTRISPRPLMVTLVFFVP